MSLKSSLNSALSIFSTLESSMNMLNGTITHHEKKLKVERAEDLRACAVEAKENATTRINASYERIANLGQVRTEDDIDALIDSLKLGK